MTNQLRISMHSSRNYLKGYQFETVLSVSVPVWFSFSFSGRNTSMFLPAFFLYFYNNSDPALVPLLPHYFSTSLASCKNGVPSKMLLLNVHSFEVLTYGFLPLLQDSVSPVQTLVSLNTICKVTLSRSTRKYYFLIQLNSPFKHIFKYIEPKPSPELNFRAYWLQLSLLLLHSSYNFSSCQLEVPV